VTLVGTPTGFATTVDSRPNEDYIKVRSNGVMKKTLVTLAVTVVMLTSSLAAHAQASMRVEFSTTFSFYVGKTKLPAGSYVITQSQEDQSLFKIQSATSNRSVMITGRQSTKPTTDSTQVLFNRYGSTEYLGGVLTSTGTGITLDNGAPEQAAAAKGAPTPHTVAAK
jgi:hypothetical protein